MVFIPYMRGATAHEGQIGRLGWRVPYLRFGGLLWASFYWTDKNGDI